MPVFPDDFAPEFAAVDQAVGDYWLGAAGGAIDPVRFSCAGMADQIDNAIVLKASHLLKESGQGTGPAVPAGSITSESRGGKSLSRATGGAATGEHGSTVYGQALDNLLLRVDKAPRRHPPTRPQPC